MKTQKKQTSKKNPFRIINRALRDARVKRLDVATGAWGVGVNADGRWALTGDCACPLGLCLAGTKVRKGDNTYAAATRVLGQPVGWVKSFIDGVDGNKFDSRGFKQAYNFGQRIRAKYITSGAMQVVLP